MTGKAKCKMLREIRRKIAEENDIEYITKECTYQGSCKGTCPKCESELRYLEQQLARRERMGKKIAVAAIAAGLTTGLSGCVIKDIGETVDTVGDWIDSLKSRITGNYGQVEGSVPCTEEGIVPDDTDDGTYNYTDGDGDTEEITELEGDVCVEIEEGEVEEPEEDAQDDTGDGELVELEGESADTNP